jgi:EAL and modified HD-GYP domain-containing signal transduction protein
LDDFRYTPEQEPLLELATIVKLDVQAIPRDELAGEVARLKPRGLQLLAEKVETHAQRELPRVSWRPIY